MDLLRWQFLRACVSQRVLWIGEPTYGSLTKSGITIPAMWELRIRAASPADHSSSDLYMGSANFVWLVELFCRAQICALALEVNLVVCRLLCPMLFPWRADGHEAAGLAWSSGRIYSFVQVTLYQGFKMCKRPKLHQAHEVAGAGVGLAKSICRAKADKRMT